MKSFGKDFRKRSAAEYDQFLSEYLDFGSLFEKSEAELATMNRRIGELYLTAAGESAASDGDGVPADNGGWMVQAMYLSMGKRHDYRPALKAVHARTLIIHGEAYLVPESVSRMYEACLSNSRLHIMKNDRRRVGHFAFSEEPETFSGLVSEFLAQKR